MSANYFQDNKERIKKKPVKDIKVFLKKKILKSDNMAVKDLQIYKTVKNKIEFSIEKHYKTRKKIIRNYIHLEIVGFSRGMS